MTIPIVFSTDDNYVLPLSVAIKSLLDKKNRNDDYIINVLYSKLSKESKDILFKVVNLAAEIKFICVDKYLQGNDFATVGHVTIETYFRYFIPIIFKDYEKIIYLDCDILVKKDIGSLFSENIEGFLLGASRHITDKLDKVPTYFNAGILLINIKEFNGQDMCKKCLEYTKENQEKLRNNDEEVLNELCKNNTKFISYKYNFQTWYCLHENLLKQTNIKRIKDIAIIHYYKKPWKAPNTPFGDLWWKTAKTLPKEVYALIKEKYAEIKNTENPVYYKYYFANPIKKIFIKVKNKFKSNKG